MHPEWFWNGSTIQDPKFLSQINEKLSWNSKSKFLLLLKHSIFVIEGILQDVSDQPGVYWPIRGVTAPPKAPTENGLPGKNSRYDTVGTSNYFH